VFVGSVQFSERMLRVLLDMKADIVGVVCKETIASDTDQVGLDAICSKHGVSFIKTDNVNSATVISQILAWGPDVIFCMGWSQIFSRDLLSIPVAGVIGYHPSLLPRNRGRHPIIWPLVLGLDKTGSTFFYIDEGVDSGDIIDQRVVELDTECNASNLYNRLLDVAENQLKEFFPLLEQRKAPRLPQNHGDATYWRKRTVSDGLIDWRLSTRTLINLVRALDRPYCGAHFFWQENKIVVWRAEKISGALPDQEPGKVLDIASDGIVVKVGDGALKLVDYSGSIEVKVGDYL
jgi:methionyl-tRNA formyltransferase